MNYNLFVIYLMKNKNNETEKKKLTMESPNKRGPSSVSNKDLKLQLTVQKM